LKVQARLQGSPTGPTQIAVGTPDARPGDAATPAAAPAAAAAGPKPEEGAVSFIDNAVDPTTGTIKLKATFPNTSHSLWPGLFVQVTLLLTTDRDALVVPATAVQESQQGTYVYVIKPDHTAEMRNVQVDRQQGEETVIAQGVTAGEEVVTDGHLRLVPGARVTTGAESGGRGRAGTGGGRGRQGGQGGDAAPAEGARGRRSGGTS
jgi:multidrug efflux system membrane fusion protein